METAWFNYRWKSNAEQPYIKNGKRLLFALTLRCLINGGSEISVKFNKRGGGGGGGGGVGGRGG